MSQPEISPLVLTFLRDHVGNLEQFQLLIRLAQEGDRWWDAASVSRELALTPRDARAALDHLARHNLLDIRITGDVRYQFRPGTDELSDAVRAVVEEYRRKPVQILEQVTGRTAKQRIRDFADAFRIRRDDDR
jgi:hypothetical protein